MTQFSSASGRILLGGAVALSLVMTAAAPPAEAKGGDITRGVLMGLATGVVIDQLSQHYYPRRYAQPTYVQPQTQYYYRPVYAPAPNYTYSAPSYYGSPLSRAFNSQDQRLRVSIQYNLMQQGYYNAALDGAWGPATQNALYNYAQTHNELALLTNEADANRLFSDILR